MIKSLKIGNVVLDNNVVLAPMAGVSNQSFREIAKEFNVGLVCAEMVSDQAINFRNEKTLKMTQVSANEHPISMQLFGSDKDSVIMAAKFLDTESNCDIIDFNMGCPAPKIVNNNSGSALMKDLDKAYEIVKGIVDNVSKPVTVKFRSGFDNNSINAVECAIMLEKAGVSAITIHPRTRTQMYNGKADYSIIKQVKESVSIPVIGNGDITSYEDAKRMLEETNCDGVMIGRAAFGNPWVLKEVVDGLSGKDHNVKIETDDIHKYIIKHFDSLIELKGEKIATREMRSHISWYISGLPLNKRMKDVINQLEDKDLMIQVINEYFEVLKEDEDDVVKDLEQLIRSYRKEA